jgi:hypothetical protein
MGLPSREFLNAAEEGRRLPMFSSRIMSLGGMRRQSSESFGIVGSSTYPAFGMRRSLSGLLGPYERRETRRIIS